MDPDNPYAAPQTIEPQLASDEQLPVATLTGRQRFPEMDTATLLQLAKWSRAIEGSTTLWSILMVNALGVTLFWVILGRSWSIYLGLLLVLDGVLIFRLYADAIRRSFDRIVIVLTDGLSLVGLIGLSFAALIVFLRKPSWDYAWGILVLGLPIWILVRSIHAALSAPILFGPRPFLHRELVEEADYRRAHGIL